MTFSKHFKDGKSWNEQTQREKKNIRETFYNSLKMKWVGDNVETKYQSLLCGWSRDVAVRFWINDDVICCPKPL